MMYKPEQYFLSTQKKQTKKKNPQKYDVQFPTKHLCEPPKKPKLLYNKCFQKPFHKFGLGKLVKSQNIYTILSYFKNENYFTK